MTECYVYIIAIESAGLRKIGISENPAARLAQLRTGSPFDMSLERTYPLISRAEALTIEKRFHRNFSVLRESREWFRVDWGSAQDAVSCIIAEFVACDVLCGSPEMRRGHLRARGLDEFESIILDCDFGFWLAA